MPPPDPPLALPAAEFQQLPLDYIIASPLLAVVKAQQAVAASTRDYILSFLDPPADGAPAGTPRKPVTVDFALKVFERDKDDKPTDKSRDVTLSVPLLSMVPVPHLRIDSLTTHFKYEIAQTVGATSDSKKALDGGVSISKIPFLDFSLKGSVASTSATQSSTNRSGVLEITVHASEAPIPEGLARLLTLLAKMAEPLPKP